MSRAGFSLVFRLFLPLSPPGSDNISVPGLGVLGRALQQVQIHAGIFSPGFLVVPVEPPAPCPGLPALPHSCCSSSLPCSPSGAGPVRGAGLGLGSSEPCLSALLRRTFGEMNFPPQLFHAQGNQLGFVFHLCFEHRDHLVRISRPKPTRQPGQEHGVKQKKAQNSPGLACFPACASPPGPAASAAGSGKCLCAGLSVRGLCQQEPQCFSWFLHTLLCSVTGAAQGNLDLSLGADLVAGMNQQ